MKNFWQKTKQPILALAPMAGVTDSAYRALCRKNGADVVYTEMTAIDALYYGSEKTMNMLKKYRSEKPVVLQLFGKRPELVAKAVKHVEAAGFSGIDINFGCPARKVVAHGGGVTLLKNLDLVYELVRAVCESTKLPVSVKTRTSINTEKGKVTVLDFIEKIKDLPVSTLMLHGRSYEEAFSGPPNYEMLKKAKEKFNGIVIGNGGINEPADAKKMLELTGVDGLGIARTVYGRPWIFDQIKEYLKTGKFTYPDMNKIKKIAWQHAKLNYKAKGDHGIVEMRKHLCWYFKGFPGASAYRKGFVTVESLDDIKKVLKAMNK
jgi:tRNA-dihydrouridine synthase B